MKKPLLSIIMLTLASASFCQAPNLRSTSVFALFTANGSFTNSGASNVTGNIGTDAGAYTGFPPGTLTGTAHIADAVSAQAALDVSAAYGEISSNTCGIVLGTTLGSDQTLTPNTYCLGASSVLDGNLILDGQNIAGALFIIKVGGAFSSSTNASVTLINGAQAKNVYWQVGGQVTLGDNTSFFGTILADGAIIMLDGASLTGRALSVNGAITLNNNVVLLNATVLAVSLLNFDAHIANRQVVLNWTTATEQNSAGFAIERSNSAGGNFITAGTVPAATNSSIATNYSFTDKNAASGINYYRLISKSINGSIAVSKTIAVNVDRNAAAVSVFPNPMQDHITVKGAAKNSYMQVTDAQGKSMITQLAVSGNNEVIETGKLKAGIYFLNIKDAAGQSNTIKLFKP